MTKEMNRTRYLTLLGTIITQFALGSVYTWSLFNAQLSDKLDEPVSQVAFAFGLLSLSLAVASSLAGKLQSGSGCATSPWGLACCSASGEVHPLVFSMATCRIFFQNRIDECVRTSFPIQSIIVR